MAQVTCLLFGTTRVAQTVSIDHALINTYINLDINKFEK